MKTLKLLWLSAICYWLCAPGALAQSGGSVRLEILPPGNLGSNTIASYRAHWSQTPGTYTYSQSLTGTNLTLLITNLAWGPWYFSGVTIANGWASDPSPEILWTNKPPAPGLRINNSTNGGVALQSSPDMQSWATLAIIMPSNPPLTLAAQPRQFFRTKATNSPPLPQ